MTIHRTICSCLVKRRTPGNIGLNGQLHNRRMRVDEAGESMLEGGPGAV